MKMADIKDHCYVYVVYVGDAIRYVGKGTGPRLTRHMEIARGVNRRRDAGDTVRASKFHNRLAKALRNGAEIRVTKIAEGLTSSEALAREIQEIQRLGSGLWNTTAGGDGIDTATAKRMWADPDYRAKALELRRSPEFKDKVRSAALKQFSRPEARAESSRRSKALWDDVDYRARVTKHASARWDDPNFRDQHRSAVKDGWAKNPDRRKRRGEITAAYSSSPEFRAKRSAGTKALWDDPEYRKKATAQWSDPAVLAKRAQNLTPEFLKRRGEAIARGLRAKKEKSNSD